MPEETQKGPNAFSRCENKRCTKPRWRHTPQDVKDCKAQVILDAGESAGSRHTR